MAGIPLTEARRSQLLEQLLSQQNRPRQISSSIQLAAELGAKTVDLTSRPSRDAANRMYKRLGFEARETNVYRYSQ